MLEWNGNFDETINDQGRDKHEFASVISRGMRAAVINREDLQIVMGLVAPISTNRQVNNYGVLLYLSFDHGFMKP